MCVFRDEFPGVDSNVVAGGGESGSGSSSSNRQLLENKFLILFDKLEDCGDEAGCFLNIKFFYNLLP